jgi:hypothetical protein
MTKKAASVAARRGGNVRIVKQPTKEQLRLNERQQSALSELFAWEKRSAKRDFVLGQPSCCH